MRKFNLKNATKIDGVKTYSTQADRNDYQEEYPKEVVEYKKAQPNYFQKLIVVSSLQNNLLLLFQQPFTVQSWIYAFPCRFHSDRFFLQFGANFSLLSPLYRPTIFYASVQFFFCFLGIHCIIGFVLRVSACLTIFPTLLHFSKTMRAIISVRFVFYLITHV